MILHLLSGIRRIACIGSKGTTISFWNYPNLFAQYRKLLQATSHPASYSYPPLSLLRDAIAKFKFFDLTTYVVMLEFAPSYVMFIRPRESYRQFL